MSDLPEPLTTADMTIIELDSFMLNTEQLLRSELWAISTGDEFKAAVGLWCRAWKQIPAGSLPDDEKILAGFSGAGSKWKKVRGIALRGFVKCSDGRLYHKTLCEDVTRAWKSKVERHKRTEAAAAARRNGGNVNRDDLRNGYRNDDSDDAPTIDVTSSHRQGQGHRQVGGGGGERAKTPPPPPEKISPELQAISDAGGFLVWKNQDLRGEWLIAVDGLTVEEIKSALERLRRPDGGRCQMPSGFSASLIAERGAERARGEKRSEEAARIAREARERAEDLARREAASAAMDSLRRHAASLLELMSHHPGFAVAQADAVRRSLESKSITLAKDVDALERVIPAAIRQQVTP